MDADFETVLDTCLARIHGGDNPDACLQAYPALADELRPLLLLATGLRAAPVPRARPESVAGGKQKVLAAFVAASQPLPPVAQGRRQLLAAWLGRSLGTGADRNIRLVLRFALGILLALVLGTTGAFAASSNSLPGDALYPVKQSFESLRLSLTVDSQSRHALEAQFESQRLTEIQALIQSRRQATAEFEDVLHAVGDNGWWTIGPFAVGVTESTVIAGQPATGDRVHVQVRVQDDGTLAALRVSVAEHDQDESDHRSGTSGLQFVSPLPTGTATHEAARDQPTETPRAGEPEVDREHQVAPTPEPAQQVLPTDVPHAPSATEPALHPQPTDAPVHHSEPTPLPAAPLSPATAPARHPEPTAEPHHDAAPVPTPLQHDGGGDNDGSGESH